MGVSLLCAGMQWFVLWPFWFGLGPLELTWEVSVINYLIYVSLSYAEINIWQNKKMIVSRKEFKERFGLESEDLKMASEEPASASAPAMKEMGLSPAEKKAAKTGDPFG